MTTSRRSVLFAAAVLGTSNVAASAEPVHPVPGIEFAFAAMVDIGPVEAPGATPYGTRYRIPILGGTFEGPRIRGKVLTGADWQLRRADGTVTLDADYMIAADDGALIHVHNRAVMIGAPGTPGSYLRASPVFEAPIGPHDWLNKAIFVGTVETNYSGKVRVAVFKVT